MHELLKIPYLQRMIYMRMFLTINSYADITEETFNEMGAYEGLSPMNINVPNYQDMNSPRLLEARPSERNLIRESSDIDLLVTNAFGQNNEDLAFQPSDQPSMNPGNL